MARIRDANLFITWMALGACATARDRPEQRATQVGSATLSTAATANDATLSSPAPDADPSVRTAHAIVSWDNLISSPPYPRAKLFPIRTLGVLEARGVVAVTHGRIDSYTPSSVTAVAQTTSAKLGFDISPAADTTFGTAADVLLVAAPGRQQIVALDAVTLVERFTVPAEKGTRVHRIGQTAEAIWIDLVYPTGAALLALDARTGRELWRAPTVAALVRAVRAKGCSPDDGRSDTITLEGKRNYQVELPTSSTCGD